MVLPQPANTRPTVKSAPSSAVCFEKNRCIDILPGWCALPQCFRTRANACPKCGWPLEGRKREYERKGWMASHPLQACVLQECYAGVIRLLHQLSKADGDGKPLSETYPKRTAPLQCSVPVSSPTARFPRSDVGSTGMTSRPTGGRLNIKRAQMTRLRAAFRSRSRTRPHSRQ